MFNEDREFTVWLVLDRTASMELGNRQGAASRTYSPNWPWSSPGCSAGAATRVGALLYDSVPDGSALRRQEAEAARRAAGHRLYAARPADRSRASPVQPPRARGTTTDIAAMIDAVAYSWPAAAASSSSSPTSSATATGQPKPLQRLAQRHEVAALRVVDTADDELPEAGSCWPSRTPETGEQLIIDSSDPLLRTRLRAAAAERDARIASLWPACGAGARPPGSTPRVTSRSHSSRSSPIPSAGAHERVRPRPAHRRPADHRGAGLGRSRRLPATPGAARPPRASRRRAAAASAGYG